MLRIKNLLDSLEVLQPLPTNTAPSLGKEAGIKAVIFDIYGTLMVSASGDVEEANASASNLQQALSTFGAHVNPAKGQTETEMLQLLITAFHNNIKKHHAFGKKQGNPFPEVDVVQVWDEVIQDAQQKGKISLTDSWDGRKMTFIYELLSNHISAMPNLLETINALKAKLPLGIVSNAQFYTPVILNYLLTGRFEERETVEGFDPEISVFSYQEFIGKPDKRLYQKLVPILRDQYNIKPSEVFFVGNDMLKDIYPASSVGFKTILFAGDERSLRLREDHKDVKGLKPDYVVDDLLQILDIVF